MLVPPGAAAQVSAEPWSEAAAKARATLREGIANAAVPGAAVAVAVQGEIVWSEGFGEASRETSFGIGSISKTLTLAAAMTLADEGRLDLDAPVERYLPDWPHRGCGITVRRLAAHQSGLADSFANRHYTSTAHFPDLESAYRHIRNERLTYQPGTRTEYATGLFTIVGRVLERVTGEPYARVMRRRVFERAGMAGTAPSDPRHPPSNRAKFYVREGGRVRPAPPVDPSFKLPGAGFLSTADDLARFGAALLGTDLISARARDEMFRPVPLADGTPTTFALAFQTVTENRRRLLLQPGGGLGIAGWLAIYPDDNVVVVILSNLTGAPLGDAVRRAVAEAFISSAAARFRPGRGTDRRTP